MRRAIRLQIVEPADEVVEAGLLAVDAESFFLALDDRENEHGRQTQSQAYERAVEGDVEMSRRLADEIGQLRVAAQRQAAGQAAHRSQKADGRDRPGEV